MRQRIRWAKGHLQAFVEIGPKLLWHIFFTGGVASVHEKGEVTPLKRLFNNIRLRFISLDMLSVVYTRSLFITFKRLIWLALRIAIICITAKGFNVAPIWAAVYSVIWWNIEGCLKNMLVALYVYIIEQRRIEKIPFFKTLWFAFTFPVFDLIGKLSLVIALFTKVEWKPIPHDSKVKITDIVKNKENLDKKQKIS